MIETYNCLHHNILARLHVTCPIIQDTTFKGHVTFNSEVAILYEISASKFID